MLGNILNEDGSSFGGDSTAPHAEEEQADGASLLLNSLSQEVRVLTSSMKSTDWLKVLLILKQEPDRSVESILRDVGAEVLAMMKAGTDGQFDLTKLGRGEGSDMNELREFSQEAQIGRLSNKELLRRMSRFTPLRLAYGEREFLRLLESAFYISDYTDQIDIYFRGNKNREIARQVRHICSILTGLVMARDYESGQRLFKDHNFKNLEQFFSRCFEIGRRYKTVNPERMRESYGKLMYMLMDTRKKHVQELLGFDCVEPVKTVWSILSAKKDGLLLLDDPLLVTATTELYEDNISRAELEYMKRKKENATKELVAKYGTKASTSGGGGFMNSIKFWQSSGAPGSKCEENRLQIAFLEADGEELTGEDVETIIYSLRDHMSFIRYNVRPVRKMLEYLQKWFKPAASGLTSECSLAIRYGVNGARLTHEHSRQYGYVQQTLELWIEILSNFMELWLCSDDDLLDAASDYRLTDTGQGLHRIKSCRRVREKMNEILRAAAWRSSPNAQEWIGSSVVHLGDHNVPNSLMFIDKYLQVPRIIAPIVLTLEHLDQFKHLIVTEYSSVDQLRQVILQDFFRHGFDGSGADNFYDAGSCIDGRLTSAWNWCSEIEKKRYYPYFLLTGFQGFDGAF